MANQATVTIVVNHDRLLADSVVAAKVAAVDLLTDLQAPVIDQTIDADATAITGPGVIERVFVIIFTAEYKVNYTTDAAQEAALTGLFVDAIRVGVPAVSVSVAIALA